MTPAIFISVDPGLAKVGGSGWARWEHLRLVATGVVRNRKEWRTVPQRVNGQFNEFAYLAGEAPVVCESMVMRFAAGSKTVGIQDLIDLNLLAGRLGDVWLTPTEWKGGVAREMEQARTRHALDLAETAVLEAALAATTKGTRKEILSAVGIGLSVCKRCHKKCGWPL